MTIPLNYEVKEAIADYLRDNEHMHRPTSEDPAKPDWEFSDEIWEKVCDAIIEEMADSFEHDIEVLVSDYCNRHSGSIDGIIEEQTRN